MCVAGPSPHKKLIPYKEILPTLLPILTITVLSVLPRRKDYGFIKFTLLHHGILVFCGMVLKMQRLQKLSITWSHFYPTIFLGLGGSRISPWFNLGKVWGTERINEHMAMGHGMMERLDLGFSVDSVSLWIINLSSGILRSFFPFILTWGWDIAPVSWGIPVAQLPL